MEAAAREVERTLEGDHPGSSRTRRPSASPARLASMNRASAPSASPDSRSSTTSMPRYRSGIVSSNARDQEHAAPRREGGLQREPRRDAVGQIGVPVPPSRPRGSGSARRRGPLVPRPDARACPGPRPPCATRCSRRRPAPPERSAAGGAGPVDRRAGREPEPREREEQEARGRGGASPTASGRGEAPDEGFLDGLLHGRRPVDASKLGHGVDGQPVGLQDGREDDRGAPEAGVAVDERRRRRPPAGDATSSRSRPNAGTSVGTPKSTMGNRRTARPSRARVSKSPGARRGTSQSSIRLTTRATSASRQARTPLPPRRGTAARPGSWAVRRPRAGASRGRTGWRSRSGCPTGRRQDPPSRLAVLGSRATSRSIPAGVGAPQAGHRNGPSCVTLWGDT